MPVDIGFRDMRNAAELLLSPRRPASRSSVNISSLKVNIGGTAAPGVISSTTIPGPLRQTLGRALANKATAQGLSAAVNQVIKAFDQQHTALKNGTFIAPDPLFQPAANGIPSAESFLSFSSLAPGQTPPASFNTVIEQRKQQLQQLAKSFAAVSSVAKFGGVSITENTSPVNFPSDDDIDVPSTPRLSQGGSLAFNDPIIKDKIRFAVTGVPIGSGRPNFWSRLIGAAISAAPNLNPVVNQLFRDRKKQGTWSEPVSAYAAQFPYNKVAQTESGHVMEWDDTPGAERVHIFHRAGSFIEMHPNGTVVYKNMRDGYFITMSDQYIKVNGKCHIAVDGGATFYCKGDIDVQGEKDINIQSKGDFNVYAQNINLRAKKRFKGDGTLIDLRYINLPSGIVPIPMSPFMAPRVNLAAIKADFPGNNLSAVASKMATLPLDPRAAQVPLPSLGKATSGGPQESPLSNQSVYSKVTPAAVAYRAHLFDTPEEVHDFEMYLGHTSLQDTLKDTKGTERQLGGALRTVDTGLVAPTNKPAIDYLNFDDFKGNYAYANDVAVGNTSFILKDLVDLALHSDIVEDVSAVGTIEGVAGDVTSAGASGKTSTHAAGTKADGDPPDDPHTQAD